MVDPSRHLRVRQIGGIELVTFDRLALEAANDRAVSEIGEELSRLVEPGRLPRVLLDFEDAEFFITAHLMGKLLGLRKLLLEVGGSLKLANVGPTAGLCLRLGHLDAVLPMYDSAEQALEAFAFEVLPSPADARAAPSETRDLSRADAPPGGRAGCLPPESTRLGRVIVVRTTGRALGAWDDPKALTRETLALIEQIRNVIDETECDLVLDLRSLDSMRNFTGHLIAAREALAQKGRRLALCLGIDLRHVFEITRLDRVFPCFRSLEPALAWLAGPVEGSNGDPLNPPR